MGPLMGQPTLIPQSTTKAQMADALEQRRRNYSLPQPFYNDADIFDAEIEEIWAKEWIFAGLSCEIPAPGNYFTLQIGRNPIVVVRDRQGQINAFHNVCRHRGSKICQQPKGKVAKLSCPYHQWTYELTGELMFAGHHMGEDFKLDDFPLHSIHCRSAGGYIYISMADNPPEIDNYLGNLGRYLEPHDLDNAKIAVEVTIIEDANWKLVMENNRECFHCNVGHPELQKTLQEWDDVTDPRATEEFLAHMDRKGAQWDLENIPYDSVVDGNRSRMVRIPFTNDAVSMTNDGKAASSKLMGRVKTADMGSVRHFHLPNSWNHALGDHSIAFQVLPLGPEKTQLTTKWMVHKDAVEGVDYDPARLIHIWDTTNQQDKTMAENNQRGINSMAYRPGPYCETIEFGVVSFLDWYTEAFLKNHRASVK